MKLIDLSHNKSIIGPDVLQNGRRRLLFLGFGSLDSGCGRILGSGGLAGPCFADFCKD
jgi:hypothetical protein